MSAIRSSALGPGHEVSCVALGVLVKYVEHVGRDAAGLLGGWHCSEEHLRDQHAAIDYETFRGINRRFKQMFHRDPDICYRAGMKVFELESFGFQHIVGPLLATSPAILYRTCPRMLQQQFTTIRMSYQRTGPKSCQLVYHFDEGYQPFVEFVDVVRGMMTALPRSFGASAASVQVISLPDGFALDIEWPRPPNVFRRLLNTTVGRLRSLRRAVTELERSHTLLEQRLAEARELSRRLDALLALGKSVERGLDAASLLERFSSVLEENLRIRAPSVVLSDGRRHGEHRCAALLPPDAAAVAATHERFVHLTPTAAEGESTGGSAGADGDSEAAWGFRLEGQEQPSGWLLLTAAPAAFAAVDQSLLLDGLSRLTHALQNVVAFQELQEHRRSLEEKVERRTAELAAHAERLQVSNTKLVQIDRAKRRFFSHLAHELKNPMALLYSAVEALGQEVARASAGADAPSAVKLEELVHIGRQNATRVSVAVDDLMDLALLEESKLRARPRSLDLVKVCADMARDTAPWGAELGVAVEVQAPVAELWVTADPRLLNKLLLNLVGNAIKFSPRDSVVTLQLVTEASDVRVGVLDRGPGIPAAERERIFEPFEQTEEGIASRAGRGTGLGLSIAREIARLHGGELTVEERLGGGSAFVFRGPIVLQGTQWRAADGEFPSRLPSERVDRAPPGPEDRLTHCGIRRGGPNAQEVLEAQLSGVGRQRRLPRYLPDFSTPKKSNGGTATRQWPARGRPRVLLVDDEPDILRTEGGLLQEEFDVEVAESAMAALELIERAVPDAIVSDVMMPGMSGLQLCEQLRQNPRTEHVPVLLLTAFGELPDTLRGFAHGASDYVSKPFHHAELAARLRTQIRLRQLLAEVTASSGVAAVGTMAAGIAHELKNPLNILLNAVEPLRSALQARQGDGDQVGELLDLISESGSRLHAVSQSFSRLAGASPRPVLLDVAQFLRDLVASRRNRSQGRIEPQLCCELSEPVPVPQEQLSLVVGNLLDNAIDALLEAEDRRASLVIRCTRTDTELQVQVQDNGVGMDREQLARSVELFTTSKRPGKGTGMGLTIVRHILVALDGRLEITSAVGEGTTATAWLPVPQEQ